jgi:hypothetical protein
LDRNQQKRGTYNTIDEIALNFPYWQNHQVRYFIDVLVERDILIKGNHNKSSFDKTCWYAFKDEEKWNFSNKSYERENSQIERLKSSNRKEKIRKTIPSSLPSSLASSIQDLGQKMTLAVHKEKEKTLDICKRWNVSEEQSEAFNFLKKCGIDAEDKKLCYWAKNFPLQRLIDVYNEAKHNKAKSLRMYMSKLLDENKVVFNCRIEANSQFAKDFMSENKWHGPKVYKKYMRIPIGLDYTEISFDMESKDFIHRFLEKYENTRR